MSRMGAKTYSRKTECRTSVQFDHLLADKSNKPSTAKVSVAAVHRWGMTSFTSLRKAHLNGQKDGPLDTSDHHVKRIKVEPKSSVVGNEDPFNFESDFETPTSKHQSLSHSGVSASSGSPFIVDVKPVAPKPNKFFKSSASRTRLTERNPQKKNDFDTLRLSVSTNYHDLKTEEESTRLSHLPSQHCNSRPFDTSVTQKNISTVEGGHVRQYFLNTSNTCASTEHYESSCSIFGSPKSPSDISVFSNRTDLYKENSRTYSLTHSKYSELDENSNGQQMQSGENIEVVCDVDRTSNKELSCDRTMEYSTGGILDDTLFLTKDSPDEKLYLTTEQSSYSKSNSCDSTEQMLYSKPVKSDSMLYSFTKSCTSDEISKAKINTIVKSHTYPLTSVQNSENSQQLMRRTKKIFSSSKKHKAVYNHRHWQATKDQEQLGEKDAKKLDDFISNAFDIEADFECTLQSLPQKETWLQRPTTEAISTESCVQQRKKLYTVVQNVKQAYQCHESGETQEFNDDIEYLLESVQESNGIGTRCLSVLSLATKCMGPAFRIHLRAHGTMPKIFSALQDAPSDHNLSLCTATLMFVLSQDRLTMDIEASTLSLMLKLLETDPEIGSKEREIDLILEDPALCAMQEKHREKVYQLCEQMQQKGHAKHLKLDNINTGILAMETLLSLTSRKAGEWFKEEIRTLHGLDHIVDTVTSCVSTLILDEKEVIVCPSESQLDITRKIDRCLRVLENISYMNYENQDYLINYHNSLLITSSLSLLKLCESHLIQNKPINFVATSDEPSDNISAKSDSAVLSCLLSLLKVLLNITHENQLGSSQVASEEGLMDHVLRCILQVPRAVSPDKRFDLLVLSLGILINLVEHSTENARQLAEMHVLGSFDTLNDGYELPALEGLVEVLMTRLEAARQSEVQADALLSSQEERSAASTEKKDTDNGSTQADDLEETLMKTLQKAGKHMEHSIIAAYIALLLGCVIENNKAYADVIRDHLPEGKFDVMVDVLRKFHSFVSLTGVVGNTGVKSIQRVIEILESS